MAGYDPSKDISTSKTSAKQDVKDIKNVLIKGSTNPGGNSTPKKGIVLQQKDLNLKKTNLNTGLAKAISDLKITLTSILNILKLNKDSKNDTALLKQSIDKNTQLLTNILKNISEYFKNLPKNNNFDTKSFIPELINELDNKVFNSFRNRLYNIDNNINSFTQSNSNITEDVLNNSLSEFKTLLSNIVTNQTNSRDYSLLFNQSLSKLDNLSTNLTNYNSKLEEQFNKIVETNSNNQKIFESLKDSVNKMSEEKHTQINYTDLIKNIADQIAAQNTNISTLQKQIAQQKQDLASTTEKKLSELKKRTIESTTNVTKLHVLNIDKLTKSINILSDQFSSLKAELPKESKKAKTTETATAVQSVIPEKIEQSLQTYMSNVSDKFNEYTEKVSPLDLEKYITVADKYFLNNSTLSENLMKVQDLTKNQQNQIIDKLSLLSPKEEEQKEILNNKAQINEQVLEQVKEETKPIVNSLDILKNKTAIDQKVNLNKTLILDEEQMTELKDLLTISTKELPINEELKNEDKNNWNFSINNDFTKPIPKSNLSILSVDNIADRNIKNNIKRTSNFTNMNNRLMELVNENIEQIKYNTNLINNRHLPNITQTQKQQTEKSLKKSGLDLSGDELKNKKLLLIKPFNYNLDTSNPDAYYKQIEEFKKNVWGGSEPLSHWIKRAILTRTKSNYDKGGSGSYGIGYRLGAGLKNWLANRNKPKTIKEDDTGKKLPENQDDLDLTKKPQGDEATKEKSPIVSMLPNNGGFLGNLVSGVFNKLSNKNKNVNIPLVRVSTVDFVKRVGLVGGMSGMSDKLTDMIDQNEIMRKLTRNSNKNTLEALQKKATNFIKGGGLGGGTGGMPDMSKLTDTIKGGKLELPDGMSDMMKQAKDATSMLKNGGSAASGGASLGGALASAAGAAFAASVAATGAWGAAHAEDYAKESGQRFDGSAMDYVDAGFGKINHVFGEGAFQRLKATVLTGDLGRLVGIGNEYGDDFTAADFYALNKGLSRESILARKRKKVELRLTNEFMENTDVGRKLKANLKLLARILKLNEEVMKKASARIAKEGLKDDKGNAIQAPKNVLDMTKEFAFNLNIELSGAMQAALAQQKTLALKNIEVLKSNLGKNYTDTNIKDDTSALLRKHAEGFLSWEAEQQGVYDVYGTVKKGLEKKPDGQLKVPLNITINRLKGIYRQMLGDESVMAMKEQIQAYESAKGVSWDDIRSWRGDYAKIINSVKRYTLGQIKQFEELQKNKENIGKADAAAAKLQASDMLNFEKNRRRAAAEASGSKPTKDQMNAALRDAQTKKLQPTPVPGRNVPDVSGRVQKQVQYAAAQTSTDSKGNVTVINNESSTTNTDNSKNQVAVYNSKVSQARGPATLPNNK